jgi:hypothetical protein
MDLLVPGQNPFSWPSQLVRGPDNKTQLARPQTLQIVLRRVSLGNCNYLEVSNAVALSYNCGLVSTNWQGV